MLRKAGDGYGLLGTAYTQGLVEKTQPTTHESLRDQEFVL